MKLSVGNNPDDIPRPDIVHTGLFIKYAFRKNGSIELSAGKAGIYEFIVVDERDRVSEMDDFLLTDMGGIKYLRINTLRRNTIVERLRDYLKYMKEKHRYEDKNAESLLRKVEGNELIDNEHLTPKELQVLADQLWNIGGPIMVEKHEVEDAITGILDVPELISERKAHELPSLGKSQKMYDSIRGSYYEAHWKYDEVMLKTMLMRE